MAKEYFFFAMPVMVIVSSNAVTENLGQIVVQAFWNSEEVGYYSGAGKVTTVFLFAGSAAGTLIFPTLSALNSRRDAQRVRDLTHRAERFMLLLLLPCGVLLTCFSPEIVRLLLGSQFDRAVPVLCILTWSMIVAVVSVPYSTQIIGTGRVRVSAALSVLLMALMVSMNVLFVPRSICGMPWLGWGAPGSAWANLVATVIMAAVYRGFALRITGTGLNVRALKLLPAAAAMALVVYGARHVWSSALAGGAIAVAGSAIYAGAAALLGELTRDDFEYLRSVVSPQRMTSYVMEEFRAGSDAPPAGHEDSNS
jgi:O-antigen/teichoic acid export membrane protein